MTDKDRFRHALRVIAAEETPWAKGYDRALDVDVAPAVIAAYSDHVLNGGDPFVRDEYEPAKVKTS